MTLTDTLADRLDGLFADWDRPGSPGCTLGVVRHGELIYERGYGMASLEHGVPITSDSVFYIASTSKQFTAACIVLLARQGELSLDDDIHAYVPEVPQYERTIRVKDLLHHTSGLRDYLELMLYAGGKHEDEFATADAVRSIARQRELNFIPGTKFQYSNSNYVLLAEVVGRVTGTSLRELARDNVFTPLGMAHTHFDDNHREVVEHRVVSYEKTPSGGFEHFLKGIDAVGDGNLLTTVADLARWDENFYTERVGGPGFTEQMVTPGRLADGSGIEYAAGLFPASYRGLGTVHHAGGFLGYRAQLLRFPDLRLSIICLCNLAAIDAVDLAYRVADAYLDHEGIAVAAPDVGTSHADQAAATPPPPELALSGSQLADYAGHYRSEELDTTHSVTVADGRLSLFLRRAPGYLVPQATDEFRVPDLADVTCTFTRDARGVVTGLVLSSARLRNLRFTRVA